MLTDPEVCLSPENVDCQWSNTKWQESGQEVAQVGGGRHSTQAAEPDINRCLTTNTIIIVMIIIMLTDGRV